jgi:predicted nucleotidyltransferase
MLENGAEIPMIQAPEPASAYDSTTMNLHLTVPRAALSAFCVRWSVAEVAVFGSALGPRFGPHSDVDLLVTPQPGVNWSLLEEVDMREELAGLFGRPVDLLVRSAVERSPNWIRRREILSTAEPIYATG